MKGILVAVFDKKGKIYTYPEVKRTPAVAIRDFKSICENKQAGINKYPEDFCLCILGEYDNETGIINSLKETKILIEANDLIIKDNMEVFNEKKN